jgi:hypothetical protein
MTRENFEILLRRGVDHLVDNLPHWLQDVDHPTKEEVRGLWARGAHGLEPCIAAEMWTSLLFVIISPGGGPINNKADKMRCGCLTQIRGDVLRVAYTPELTSKIRKDVRIPNNFDDLYAKLISAQTPEKIRAVLEPFVEHQLECRDVFGDLLGI